MRSKKPAAPMRMQRIEAEGSKDCIGNSFLTARPKRFQVVRSREFLLRSRGSEGAAHARHV